MKSVQGRSAEGGRNCWAGLSEFTEVQLLPSQPWGARHTAEEFDTCSGGFGPYIGLV